MIGQREQFKVVLGTFTLQDFKLYTHMHFKNSESERYPEDSSPFRHLWFDQLMNLLNNTSNRVWLRF